jgi:L-lactate dehydrogenase
VVNEKGVIKTLNLALSPREMEQLHNSAKIMRDLIDQLKI